MNVSFGLSFFGSFHQLAHLSTFSTSTTHARIDSLHSRSRDMATFFSLFFFERFFLICIHRFIFYLFVPLCREIWLLCFYLFFLNGGFLLFTHALSLASSYTCTLTHTFFSSMWELTLHKDSQLTKGGQESRTSVWIRNRKINSLRDTEETPILSQGVCAHSSFFVSSTNW